MKRVLRALVIIVILATAIVTVGYVINFRALTTETSSVPSPTPTPATTLTNNVTVSGLIISHGLTIPPTEVPVHKHRNP